MRRIAHILPLAIALAPAHGPLSAQPILTLLEGSNASALNLIEIDLATNLRRVVLSNIEVLPVGTVTRPANRDLFGSSPTFESTPVAHLAFPGGRSLIKYRGAAGREFGFVYVSDDGAAVLLSEPSRGGDPFDSEIAVSPTGDFAVIPEGDDTLHILRLDGQTFSSSNRAARTVTVAGFEDDTLCVGRDELMFVTEDDEICRCDLSNSWATPQTLPMPQTFPARETEERIVVSGDGSTFVFVSGPDNGPQSLWMVRNGAAPQRLQVPQTEFVVDADEHAAIAPGPPMLLNHDGSRLFYTENAEPEDEFFLLDTLSGTLVHITHDHVVQPYIGVTILPAFSADTLIVALGDNNSPTASASFDWYTVDMAGITNVTRTAAESMPPFGWGHLEPIGATTPVAGCVLTEERNNLGTTQLRCVAADGTTTVMVPQLRGALVPGSGHDPMLVIPNTAGDCLLTTNPLQLMIQGPPGIWLGQSARLRSGDIAFAASLPQGVTVPMIWLENGPILALGPPAPHIHQVVAIADAEGVIVNGETLRYISRAGVRTLQSPAPIRIVLN